MVAADDVSEQTMPFARGCAQDNSNVYSRDIRTNWS